MCLILYACWNHSPVLFKRKCGIECLTERLAESKRIAPPGYLCAPVRGCHVNCVAIANVCLQFYIKCRESCLDFHAVCNWVSWLAYIAAYWVSALQGESLSLRDVHVLHQGNNTYRAPGKPCRLGDLTSMQVNFTFLLNISGIRALRTCVTLVLWRSEDAILDKKLDRSIL